MDDDAPAVVVSVVVANELVLRVIVGAVLAIVIGFAGHRARALSWSGAVAAAIVGTAAAAAGWSLAVVLIAYFGVSSLLSKLGARRKRARMAGVVDKTGARDATQVMANGFPFLICALMSMIDSGHADIWKICAVGSLAASAADTWATEIGTLVGQTPRSILTFRRMTVGESGGVTLVGWIAAAAGATFVATVAVVAGNDLFVWPFIFIGGFVGAAVDSLVGASIQRRGWCDACDRATEMRIHVCGTVTRHTGGLAWLENDGVNLIATVTGAVVPWPIIVLLGHLIR